MRLSYLVALLAVVPYAARAQNARTIVRYGFSDGAVEIIVRPGAIIAIAAAQGDSAATVTVHATDARAWTDSTRRIVHRAAPRKRTVVVLQRSQIAEAADSGAAMSLIRRAETDTTTFELHFATRSGGGFPLTLERREADLFLAAMRRAVAVALPSAPKPKPKTKPKAKTATPSAPDSTS
jgi:hypothetical protein